nr:RecName: Full=Dihydrolipoyl dehydrogenase; AltName: Full=Dihydrolipoamide dehydrogenase [Populus euphratica]
VGKFPLLANSR